jgi:HemX protein
MDIMFRIHEFILLIYLVSLSVAAYDLVFRNRVARKVSFYMTLIAGVIHVLSFSYIAVSIGRIPVMTTYEGMFALSMILVIVGVIHYKFTDSEITFFVYLVSSFILLSIFTFAPVSFDRVVQVSSIMNELLFIHISLALCAYVLFFISALHAVIYIIQYGNLKNKRFNRLFFSLFSIETAQKVMVRAAFFGVAFLLISTMLGIQWGIRINGLSIFYDIKVLCTFFVLLCYAFILSFLKIKGNAYDFARLNIIVFIICMLNYFFVTQLSSFHFWND